MDSLRYWVTEMHVDGFRFDLASALARSMHDVDRLSAFFDVVHQDPVVSHGQADRRALGRRPGRLPGRQLPAAVDGVERQVPRHRPRRLVRRARRRPRPRLPADRLLGPVPLRRPPPVRQHQLRHRPRRLHDGRPGHLRAQAQRGQRRGQPGRREPQPQLELRRRGADATTRRSTALRARQVRNHLATLLLSTGVPMLTAGDELGRTQQGNNNAYCQDNEISWIDWKDVDEDLRAFVSRLVRLRRSSPVLRQEAFFEGHEIPGLPGGTRDLAWFAPDGGQLTTADWFDTGLQTLGMYLDGRGIRHRDEHGRPVVDDSLPGPAARRRGAGHRQLPGPPWADGYELVLSTEYATGEPPAKTRGRRRARSRCRPAASGCSGCSGAPDSARGLNHSGPEPRRFWAAVVQRCVRHSCGCSKVMTVQPRSRRSPSESGCATPGLELGPLGGLGPGDVGAVERAQVDEGHLAAGALQRRVRRGEHVLGVGDRHRRGPSRSVTSSWLSGRRPSTRSSSTVTTMPSSKRSTGAAGCSGRQKAVCSPDSAAALGGAARAGARAEAGVRGRGERRRGPTWPAGTAEDAAGARLGQLQHRAGAGHRPLDEVVGDARRHLRGGRAGADVERLARAVKPEASVQPSTDDPDTGTPSTAGWPLPDHRATPVPAPPRCRRGRARRRRTRGRGSSPGRRRRTAHGRRRDPTRPGRRAGPRRGRASRVRRPRAARRRGGRRRSLRGGLHSGQAWPPA